MSDWRRYDSHLIPVFHERFEQRWGKGTAPFLDPEAHEEPLPRAQWINPATGAALAVVPIWTDDDHQHRSFGVFYLPPAGDIWVLRPGFTDFLNPAWMTLNTWRRFGTTPSAKPCRTPTNSFSALLRSWTSCRPVGHARVLVISGARLGSAAYAWMGTVPMTSVPWAAACRMSRPLVVMTRLSPLMTRTWPPPAAASPPPASG
jgi:hypothetical protein